MKKNALKSTLVASLLTSLLTIAPATMAEEGWLDSLKSMLGFGEQKTAPLDEGKIGQGLKEMLVLAAKNVTSRLGQPGGFANSAAKISLPESFDGVTKALDKVGMGQYGGQLEDKINQGAEKMMALLTPILLNAISNMSMDDVLKIYQGGSSGATEYFKSTMSGPIGQAVTPLLKQSLTAVGAMDLYQKSLDKYHSIPLLPKVSTDMLSSVQDQVMNVVFDGIGKEEASIRQDPVKQGSQLLQQMFAH